METTLLNAQTYINVSQAVARQWFLGLETHPERYQFDTHEGFQFVKGNFGEAGALFETQERFYGLRFTLRFELTEVKDNSFYFRLLSPALPVWGAFVLKAHTAEKTSLALKIGATTRSGRWVLRLPLLRGAILRQINAEVEHIKTSMETLAGESA